MGKVVASGFTNFSFLLDMPHQFMSINCKECGTDYCPVCKSACPKCGTVDVADEKTMETRKQMKAHMEKADVKKDVPRAG